MNIEGYGRCGGNGEDREDDVPGALNEDGVVNTSHFVPYCMFAKFMYRQIQFRINHRYILPIFFSSLHNGHNISWLNWGPKITEL